MVFVGGTTKLGNEFQGYLENPDRFALNNGTSVREKLLNSVDNQKLKNVISEMYRSKSSVGDGGLVDAIRDELKTGVKTGGKSHLLKGTERVTNLENVIKKENLNDKDLKIAKELLEDLKNALGGK
ncbi:MAG: hypothetical protein LBT51_00835 [Fusobacteriaceae bacterium]|jgi:Glu-tRNA(Gln) amidotransferase subunit E-like FAD-binding protein|nr:hypothetical protein [Fusobacteriaceae bacterium]